MHALERSGKVRQALLLLWEVVAEDVIVLPSSSSQPLSSSSQPSLHQQQKQVWSELYQRILALTKVEDLINEGHRGGGSAFAIEDMKSLDAVRRFDAKSFAPIVNPYKQANNDLENKNETTTATVSARSSSSSVSASIRASKSGGKKSTISTTTSSSISKNSKAATSDNAPIFCYPPVTDETVLQTLSVTLRNCELYDTMSEMYHQATLVLLSPSLPSSSSSSRKDDGDDVNDNEKEENYRNVLEEGVCVHFKAVCDCSSYGTSTSDDDGGATGSSNGQNEVTGWHRVYLLQSQLPKLQSLLNRTKYFERMQSCEYTLSLATVIHHSFDGTNMTTPCAFDSNNSYNIFYFFTHFFVHAGNCLKCLLGSKSTYKQTIASLQLAKVTAQPLHFQWTAISSLWYKESLEWLVSSLEYIQKLLPSSSTTQSSNNGDHDDDKNCRGANQGSDDSYQRDAMQLLLQRVLELTGLSNVAEITSRCATLRQKMALLPRLAESLSSRMVVGLSSRDPSAVISENDWNVYLETLLVQGKKLEALEVLKNIPCTPMIGDGYGGDSGDDHLHPSDGDDDSSLRHGIDDEDTIKNHVGSMLRYTQRTKLERLARLSQDLCLFEDAQGYYQELLRAFPDQWTYWMGLVESSCIRVEPSSSSTISASGAHQRSVSIDKAGWHCCQSFAKEIAAAVGNIEKRTLRGPHLVLLELAAVELRHATCHSVAIEVDVRNRLVALLRDGICEFGNRFGSQASCCFADMRSYISVLVHASASGKEIADPSEIPNDVLHLLKWAGEMWASNTQSIDADHSTPKVNESAADVELRERKKKVRSFIFAVQVVYGIASELKDVALYLLLTFAPSVSQMISEWRTSLISLPVVSAKDGGQKEVLPGDEIVLLTSQYLLFRAPLELSSNDSSTPVLLQAAGLLEEAMDYSPYNPHLKIAAINVYSELNAADRALTIYHGLGVKQIQLDSCSYLILPLLIRGGLYTSAIKLSASILRLHGSTSKDVKTYASKTLQNGLLFKAKEMSTFQCESMRPSLQLLYSKGLLMDIAPLMIPSDLENDTAIGARSKGNSPSVRLAAEKGFCGNEDDLIRADQLSIDAEIHFNAPAIIPASAQFTKIDNFTFSDNRDMSVNYFEVLHHTAHLTQMEMVVESIRRGHIHGLLARAIMAVGAANAPKKGKLSNPTEETSYRCQSLRYALSRAKEFGHDAKLDETERALWNTCCQFCEVMIAVIHGRPGDDPSSNTVAGREKLATSIINSTTQVVQSAREALNSCYSAIDSEKKNTCLGCKVCRLLPDYIVPLFILFETTSRLFCLFGWGKRKRLTKAASGALAFAALSLRDLVTDILHIMTRFRSFSGNIESVVETASGSDFRKDVIQRVIKEVVSSRELTNGQVDSFLVQMRETLDTFNEEI